ncbi:MAG TPA: VWA domain-containing protein [Xanthobacteraceae bacterium]|nr:VWA domain-containing protein [Xanthobacteraceae bacterium]
MAKDSTPAPAQPAGKPSTASARPEIDAFIARARTLAPTLEAGRRGRLIFALDATMSRQPTWDAACQLQAEMFREAAAIGGLEVQLVYYRGFDECQASGWVTDGARLAGLMTGISCRGGRTQLGRILAHARRETEKAKAQALVFVGDAMEEEIDRLAAAAGELGLRGVPAFMFQEGDDPAAEQAFREIARLTHGAYCRFDVGAAHQLRELLRAAAAYAAGGVRALTNVRGTGAQALLQQMK